MDFLNRVEERGSEAIFDRSDRYVSAADGFYVKTREGLVGPYEDLASALNGLLQNAQQYQLAQYQMQQLYRSICNKALESCN